MRHLNMIFEYFIRLIEREIQEAKKSSKVRKQQWGESGVG